MECEFNKRIQRGSGTHVCHRKNWCAYMQDYDDAIMEKCVVEAQVT